MLSHLRVKIKSLAAEAAMIRHEESRVRNGALYWARHHQAPAERVAELDEECSGLRRHRVVDVRREARASQLAYALLRGRKYLSVENRINRAMPPPKAHITALVVRFGHTHKFAAEARVDAWLLETNP